MTGAFNIQKFATFLKSFWGILASFSVILPTIIYVFNSAQVKASILSDYYLGIPTTFALLVIPFVFLFEDKLSVLSTARSSSILFGSLSLLMLFSFLTLKSIYIIDIKYGVKGANGYGRIEVLERKEGGIALRTYDSNGQIIKEEIRVNGLELISLALYTLSIILLTASFSGLGVFFYRSQTDEAGPQGFAGHKGDGKAS